METLRDAALRYADLGYRVFPIAPGSKTPLTEHGVLDATSDAEQVERWWHLHPSANIGIATSGLLVVDIDRPDNPWLASQPERYLDLACAPLSITASGGKHYVFRQPPGKTWRNTAGQLAPNVDTRANGGYFVAPPSVVDGNRVYRWAPGLELDTGPLGLPEPPGWLIEALDRLTTESPTTCDSSGTDTNPIPEGQRDNTLARLAGTMRRVGMSREEIAAALQQVNADRCVPPLERHDVERIAGSIARYEPDQIATAMAEGHWEQMIKAGMPKLEPVCLGDLVATYPELRPPVIHGLLRSGETMNVISAPKVGKSWLVTDLALSIATSRPWLDTFAIERGDVLIVDNELHPETSANRIPKVAQARGISMSEVGNRVFVQNLRGKLQDIHAMGDYFLSLEPGKFKVIILDAFYRFMPRDTDENDNGSMANVYNLLDSYAASLGCSFVLIHHTSKGNQSGKALTDVGAGAGSQSRATDTHLVLRPHEQDDVVVLEAAVRSWQPVAPRCLRWTFPVWTPADELDPSELRSEQPRRRHAKEEPRWDVDRFVATFIGETPRVIEAILVDANGQGINDWNAKKLIRAAEAGGRIYSHALGRGRVGYATQPPVAEPADEETPDDLSSNKRTLVEKLLRESPGLTSAEVAELCQMTRRHVNRIRKSLAETGTSGGTSAPGHAGT